MGHRLLFVEISSALCPPSKLADKYRLSLASMNRHRAILAVAAVAAGIYAAVIAWGWVPHRVAYDQLLYHSAAIGQFAREFPRLDVSDYLSATTPGFHVLLASLTALFGWGIPYHQAICAVISLVWFVVLLMLATRGMGAAPRTSSAMGVVWVLPLMTSMYVFASSVWVLPDNSAWLFVTLMLLICLRREWNLQSLAAAGGVLAALVLTRQVHLWTAGIIITRSFLEGFRYDWPVSCAPSLIEKLSPRPGMGRAVVLGAAATLVCLPALLVMVYFYSIWGGLTPPTFQYQYHSVNFAAVGWLLSLFGLVAVFFAGFVMPSVLAAWHHHRVCLLLGGAAGAVAALVARTTAGTTDDYFAGRRTGVWDIAAKLPDIGGYASPLIVGLATLGAAVLTAMLLRMRFPQAMVLLCAFFGYAAALAVGGELWQRYGEPFILLMMVLLLAHAWRPATGPVGKGEGGRWGERLRAIAPAGPVVLALCFVLLNARDLSKPGTQRLTDAPPPAETASATVQKPRPDSPYSRYMISKGLLKPKS